jgi:hypothetical protein
MGSRGTRFCAAVAVRAALVIAAAVVMFVTKRLQVEGLPVLLPARG